MDATYDRRQDLHRLLIPALLILIVGLGLRWAFARQVPLFIEEAIGINWARDATSNYRNAFLGLHHARWLDSFIHSWFRPLGAEAIALMRMVTSLFGMIPVAVAISLGRRIHSSELGWIAGALLALLPFTLWFDRQILGDPFAASFAALMLWAAYGLAHERNPLLLMVCGFGLAGALLSKFQAAILIPVPLLTALIVARREDRWRALACTTLATVLAGLIVLAVLIEADRYLEPYRSILRPAFYDWNWLRTPDAAGGEFNLLAQWRETGAELWQAAIALWGPALLIALAGSLPVLLRPNRLRGPLFWLWVVGPGTMLPFVLITTWLPARYLAVLSLPLALIGALGLIGSWEAFRGPLRWRLAPSLALLAGTAALGLSLLFAPGPDKLPVYDYVSSYADWTSGKGFDEVAEALRALDSDATGPSIVISGATVNSQLWGSYYPDGLSEGYSEHDSQAIWLAGALLAGQRVYFLDSAEMPTAPYGIQAVEVGRFDGAVASYRLRVATGVISEDLQTLYWSAVFGDVEPLREDLELALNSIPIIGLIAVYPPHLASILPEGSVAEDQAVSWPPTRLGDDWPPVLTADLDTLISETQAGSLLTVLLFNETAGDPERLIETGLNGALLRFDSHYAGPLRVLQYGPPLLETQPQDAVFGGLVALDAGGWRCIDSFCVVELQWRALATPPFGFSVAAHLVDEAGNVVTQHDGLPAGGLPPMASWRHGQIVMDRFAWWHPTFLSCEACSMRIIVYDPGSGARLPLEDGSEWWALSPARLIAE